jgi:AcrR family transcriptional regulator
MGYHHGQLREALLAGAIERLRQTGNVDFSLSELARSLGVTPAAVYRHFASKDELLQAVAAAGFGMLRERFERAAPEREAVSDQHRALERLRALGQAYLEFAHAEPPLFHLIFGVQGIKYRAQFADSSAPAPSYAYLWRVLRDLHDTGSLDRAPTAEDCWFAWCAIHGAAELAISAQAPAYTSAKDAARITDYLLLALRGPRK